MLDSFARCLRLPNSLIRWPFLLFSSKALPLGRLDLLQTGNVLWCYGCGRSTEHELRYRSDPDFTGKLLVCQTCGETVKEPLGGSGCTDC